MVKEKEGALLREYTEISKNLVENEEGFKALFGECADVKMQHMKLGREQEVECFLAYIEVTVGSGMLDSASLGRVLTFLMQQSKAELPKLLDENAMGIADFKTYRFLEDAAEGMLVGDAIIFVNGYGRAIKIPDRGFPNMGVTEADSEKVIRGSNEGFSDSIKLNAALIRRRIRSRRLQVEEMSIGLRSHTKVNLVYMKDLADLSVIEEAKKRLAAYEIDAGLDTGVIEQLEEKKWYSPFPQLQSTQRPDRASLAVLEGRVVILSDNSPSALMIPTDYNSFLQTSDDYYNRFAVASFARLLRYLAAYFAMVLPGLYLAVTNFHTQILPTPLMLSFWEARQGVPFPEVVEVILMELSFELLREAGVRLPGAMGSTIGIVGGLIIGQAAVEANIVSPIVVILVSFTALCSFAIPSEEFAVAFRLLKFFFIALSAWLGFYGFLCATLAVLIHLTGLKSFGYPYLIPFVGAELTDYEGEKDAMVRYPYRMLTRRPIYAKWEERIKLRRKKDE